MKKLFLSLIVFAMFSGLVLAFASPPSSPKSSQPGKTQTNQLLIDDFEDGTISDDPEWWVFDSVNTQAVRKPAKGAYALSLKGKAGNWYVGGLGTYLAKGEQDLSQYSFIELDIYSSSQENGIFKIEFYDDDNGNWQIEQDPRKAYAPIYDDRFAYEQNINWTGWKHIKIPFSSFVDNNPEAGDNIWNPQQLGESGGFLQMQFITVAASKTGSIDFIIDDIKFTAP